MLNRKRQFTLFRGPEFLMILTVGTTPALQRPMTFDHLHIDAVNRAANVREYASGKSINAARVIHTLGGPCVATGLLGGDSGDFCRLDMDRAALDMISSPSHKRHAYMHHANRSHRRQRRRS